MRRAVAAANKPPDEALGKAETQGENMDDPKEILRCLIACQGEAGTISIRTPEEARIMQIVLWSFQESIPAISKLIVLRGNTNEKPKRQD